jgi:hypothetical protein
VSPDYAVPVKVLFPGVAVPLYAVFVVLGMFDKFTKPREGPDIPSDLDLL